MSEPQQPLPYPLGDMQRSYLAARIDHGEPAETIAVYEGHLDRDRFTRAWRALVERHPALRVTFVGDRQWLSAERLSLPVHLDESVTSRCTTVVAREPGTWPLVEIRMRDLGNGRWQVAVAFDALALDYSSWQILGEELTSVYDGAKLPPVELDFAAASSAKLAREERDQHRSSVDLQYWRDRLATLPTGPELPLAGAPSSDCSRTAPAWRRTATSVRPEVWRDLSAKAIQRRVTPTCALSATIARVLATMSRSTEFCLGFPRSDRLGLGPGAQRAVGVFSSFWPLQCAPSGRGIGDDASRLHKQMARDLSHVRVSGTRIVQEYLRSRDNGAATLPFPVVLTHLPTARTPRLLGERLPRVGGLTAMPGVALDIRVEHRPDGGLSIDWDEREGDYPDSLVPWLADAVRDLLERLYSKPETWDDTPSIEPLILERRAVAADSFAPAVGSVEQLIAAVVADEVQTARGQRIGRFDDVAGAVGLAGLGRVASRVAELTRDSAVSTRELLAARTVSAVAQQLSSNHPRPELLRRIAALQVELLQHDE